MVFTLFLGQNGMDLPRVVTPLHRDVVVSIASIGVMKSTIYSAFHVLWSARCSFQLKAFKLIKTN